MNKILLSVMVLLCLLISSCQCDSDTIAVYADGSVTRSELLKWLRVQDIPLERARNNNELMKIHLEQLILQRIAILEAKKADYEKSVRFVLLFDDISTKYLNESLLKKMQDSAKYSEKIIKLRQIVLPVSDDAKDREAKIKEAGSIIEKINKGISFNELARIYSKNPENENGTTGGYYIREFMPAEYADAAYATASDSYSKKPLYVKQLNAVCIFKIQEIKEVTVNQLLQLIRTDEMRIKFLSKLRDRYLGELLSAKDVKFYENSINSQNPGSIIFTIGDLKFTSGDLSARMKTINETTSGLGISMDQSRKSMIVREYLYELLLRREAIRLGLDKDPEFIKDLNKTRDDYLAGDYMDFAITKEINVTQQEIESAEARIIRGQKQLLPVNKNQIRQSLFMQKRMELLTRWKKDIFDQYKVRIVDSFLGSKT